MKKLSEKLNLRPLHVIGGLFVVAMCICLISCYISLNEISAEVNSAKKTLTKLEGETDVLSVQVERKNDIDEIEKIATEQLGMQKLESYQVETVNLIEGDSVSLPAGGDKQNSFFDGVVASFNILLEYLS